MEFKDNLIGLRKTRGWSQEELGNMVEVSRQTVSKWETGETTPEMGKLIILSKLFDIGLDELVKGNKTVSNNLPSYRKESRDYEYKSKRNWKGIPLIHVNLGRGFKVAKGVLAIGGISIGIISLGTLSIGLFSLAAFAFGLAAIGGMCVGLIAAGGIAIGYLAMGGIAVEIYAAGGVAIARDIGIGGYAQGIIAIGQEVRGEIIFSGNTLSSGFQKEELIETIDYRFPEMNRIIRKLFTGLVWEPSV